MQDLALVAVGQAAEQLEEENLGGRGAEGVRAEGKQGLACCSAQSRDKQNLQWAWDPSAWI